jgi:hypothetical protein
MRELINCDFRRLRPWADTGTSTGRLMLAVFGGMADVDRQHGADRLASDRPAPRRRSSAAPHRAEIGKNLCHCDPVHTSFGAKTIGAFQKPLNLL